jgi:hypothetical protein
MADEHEFEPGPSFVENERPDERLTEMPAWLQTFAASAIRICDVAVRTCNQATPLGS